MQPEALQQKTALAANQGDVASQGISNKQNNIAMNESTACFEPLLERMERAQLQIT